MGVGKYCNDAQIIRRKGYAPHEAALRLHNPVEDRVLVDLAMRIAIRPPPPPLGERLFDRQIAHDIFCG